jgi:Flp pilus assembly protein CpaB
VKDVADALGRATLDPLVEGQTVSEGSLSRQPGVSAPSSVIPVGMRAVTMHVADSLGVVQMLRAGDHVDIQLISGADPSGQGVLAIRGVMPSVEVLSVGPPELGSPLTGRPVVTVLLSPSDADRVSLADTVGRLRIVLRNRKDVEKTAANTASPKFVAAAPPPAPVVSAVAAPARDVYFDVQWVTATQPDALEALGGHNAIAGEALQVLPVTGSWPALEGEGRLSVVAKSQVLTRESGEVSLQREGAPGIRIRLEPRMRGDGRLTVRVEPSVKNSDTERRIRSDLSFAPGESFLVAGLQTPDGVFAVITPRIVVRGQK